MNVNDECPNCKSGTLERNENDLVCRGECGVTWFNLDQRHFFPPGQVEELIERAMEEMTAGREMQTYESTPQDGPVWEE
jgi:ribosomal protein S27AE